MFKNTKMTTLVMMAFAALTGIAVVLGIEASRAIKQGDDSDTLLYEQNTVGLKETGDAVDYFYRAWNNTAEALILADSREQQANLERAEKQVAQADVAVANLDKSINLEAIRAVFA